MEVEIHSICFERVTHVAADDEYLGGDCCLRMYHGCFFRV